ncbi:Fe(3+) ions import ATP-binding protein FbpC [Phocoenobacter uteri]|uniref:Fe(3+) ions import ATP-binding protein FbpC n=1 Tax=Phocoenobacter uteri TaxID=146806 RepID=A0A379C8I1_9PAST|nr:ABC transporter ATP-binding protein [Phocoenobacter uteri]MDG6882321.1 ABC transporter [Phocoenobacter uteri]SUB58479.1 Fe(3+) ions import ATP-binding protein FbpC [Phocoenobacter uteri]
MTLLDIQHLSTEFGTTKVLKDLSLQLKSDEIICLLGASGCGKTTLLKAIAGLIEIKQGTITLAEQDLTRIAVEKRQIGFIFQDYALFPHLTVAENIQFGLEKQSQKEKQSITEEILNTVKLQEFGKRYPYELSGGQQQRVAIARSLVCNPKLLLLDEPFSNIDTQTRYEMIDEIKALLKSQNVPAIFVTHNKEEAFAFADRIAIMDQGKIIQYEEPTTLYNKPTNKFVADFLGETNYLDCDVLDTHRLNSPLGQDYFEHIPYIKGKYQWLIRPEQIAININSQGQGKVTKKLFLGQQYRYNIAINDLNITAYHRQNIPIGTAVDIGFIGNEVVLL